MLKGIQLIKTAASELKVSKYITMPKVEINFSELKYEGDVAQFSKQAKKLFSKEEILNIKPSEFEEILAKRADIAPEIRTAIKRPEQLNLYDEVVSLSEVRNLPTEEYESFMKKIFVYGQSELTAQAEVLPRLIKRGYNPKMLADIPIREENKSIIEMVLNRKDLVDKGIAKTKEVLTAKWKAEGMSDGCIQTNLEANLPRIRKSFFNDIIRYANEKNIKYLDECIETTGSPKFLPYWGKDTRKILTEFGNTDGLLDRLYRKGHTYDSVKQIIGNEKINSVNARLLEFKNFDKLKDIGLDDLQKLSTAEKKELLNGFISAITPKEAAFRNQHGLDKGIEQLQSKMKIFRELDNSSKESFIASHQRIIKKILNSIPENKRTLIRTNLDAKTYMRNYRTANPIPTLVDDIAEVLPFKIAEINGYKVKLAQLDRDTAMGIATHRMPNAEAISTIEALEITDPNMLLCVGTKGGSKSLNFSTGYSDVALAVKPRKGRDWHVQAYSDIDSGNNASKNIFNFENIMLPMMGNHCECIDLVPNAVKKVLNLSQAEYTARMAKLKECRTLQEIGKIDSEMENAIRTVIKNTNMYEGLIRPEPMGVLVDSKTPLSEISKDLLSYCQRRDIPLIQVSAEAPKPAIKVNPITISV